MSCLTYLLVPDSFFCQTVSDLFLFLFLLLLLCYMHLLYY